MAAALRVLAFILVAAAFAGLAHAESLKSLSEGVRIDPGQISMSGVSSGAYMAQQLHVAHSKHVVGVGLIAGGPYRCAAGVYPPYSWFDATGLYAATSVCSDTNPYWFFQGPPDPEFSIGETRRLAADAAIDDPAGMRGDRVWLLSGSEDRVVPRAVVDALHRYYLAFIDAAAVRYVRLPGAGHAMINDKFGGPCGESAAPFITDCDFDAAGRLLEHIYASLKPRVTSDRLRPVQAFDQSAFFDTQDPSVSLHATGHVYIPTGCRQGRQCRLHVSFHGCRQDQELVGDAFYTKSGYNEWAESNDIVVLYPQATAWRGKGALGANANPRGCWDWWGYSGPAYAVRRGKQIRAVAAMIDVLVGRELLGGRAP